MQTDVSGYETNRYLAETHDMTANLVIRPLTLQEMHIPVDWAAAEGWNPGLHDTSAFHAADPHGFLAAFIDGAPAACISVVRSGEDFGFLGFYICKPEMRGKGIGWKVWQAGMEHLSGRTVGLDGVVAQQDNYRKSGFVFAHRNVRYEGRPSIVAETDPAIVELNAPMMNEVVAFDRPYFPAPRETFLRLWLSMPQSRALAFKENGVVKGYGVIRRCRNGHKIGPLFADTPEIAERLFAALAAGVPGDMVVLDLPEPNAKAVALAQRYMLAPVFETARMYRGTAPELPLVKTFGITSFELG